MSEPTHLRQEFGSMSAIRIAGITYRQLDHWARMGLVRPSQTEASGSGSRRRYSYSDLVRLRAIKRLLDAGLKLRKVCEVIDKLDAEFGADLAASNLVIDGQTPVLVTNNAELFDVLSNGQGVLNVLPMAPVQQEVDAAIVELFPPPTPDPTEGEDPGGQHSDDSHSDSPQDSSPVADDTDPADDFPNARAV